MAQTAALPVLSGETGLTRYLEEIRRFPMLEPQEEFMLAKSWREHEDREAAHRLVTSHLRLVAKIAMGYRGSAWQAYILPAVPTWGTAESLPGTWSDRFHPTEPARLQFGP